MNAGSPGGGIIAADEWLSHVTGMACYSLRAPYTDLTAAKLVAIAAGRDAFFFAKVPATECSALEPLVSAGFRLVDSNTVMECPSARYADGRQPSEVRPAVSADHDAVLEIASTAFRWSRFHMDPRFPRPLADRVKRTWAENCLLGKRGEEVLVLIENGLPAGFLAVLAAKEASRRVAVIDLVAVSPEQQGRRFGEILTQAFAARWASRVEQLRVGTQLANTAAMRLYERLGFRLTSASYVLHAHVRRGAVLA